MSLRMCLYRHKRITDCIFLIVSILFLIVFAMQQVPSYMCTVYIVFFMMKKVNDNSNYDISTHEMDQVKTVTDSPYYENEHCAIYFIS